MVRCDPTDRPDMDLRALIAALDRHGVDWVMIGSQVLALHGADLRPNDLDVLPRLTPDNLERVARCLEELGAVQAYLDGWGGDRGTLAACRAWRPRPATAEHLDWLMVTPHGMLDIVVSFAAAPYATTEANATWMRLGPFEVRVCDPARVLGALAPRARQKDARRAAVYERMGAMYRVQ